MNWMQKQMKIAQSHQQTNSLHCFSYLIDCHQIREYTIIKIRLIGETKGHVSHLQDTILMILCLYQMLTSQTIWEFLKHFNYQDLERDQENKSVKLYAKSIRQPRWISFTNSCSYKNEPRIKKAQFPISKYTGKWIAIKQNSMTRMTENRFIAAVSRNSRTTCTHRKTW